LIGWYVVKVTSHLGAASAGIVLKAPVAAKASPVTRHAAPSHDGGSPPSDNIGTLSNRDIYIYGHQNYLVLITKVAYLLLGRSRPGKGASNEFGWRLERSVQC
jgi:hypothetical protein